MNILKKDFAELLRQKYIEKYIDTTGTAYKEKILKIYKMSDGLCYIGYLWDCFKQYTLADEKECLKFLSKKNEFMIFWDINSSDYIKIKNYWNYPKDAIVQIGYTEFIEKLSTFPEDIYIFDETFSWTVVLTHETTEKGKRSCILLH